MWNLGLIIFSPCVERERLSHNGYTYLTSTKKEPLNVKTSSTTCIKNSFRLRQDLFLCLGALSFCTYNCAFLLWNALPHSCSASNQNKFKVLFPLLFFARPSTSKQIAKQFTKVSQLANSSVGETWKQIHNLAFDFKTSPLKCSFFKYSSNWHLKAI